MNGFVARQITLGSKQPTHQLKHCDRCEEKRPPEGGIQMSQSKWHCAACWTKRATKRF